MSLKSWVNIGSGIDLLPDHADDTKPLPEPMSSPHATYICTLTNCKFSTPFAKRNFLILTYFVNDKSWKLWFQYTNIPWFYESKKILLIDIKFAQIILRILAYFADENH